MKTKKIKSKDLKPGDAVIRPMTGMIVKIDVEGKDPFWEQPNITYMDAHDCVYGSMSGPLHPDVEAEILVDRKDIVDMYKKIDYEILEHIFDMMDRRKEFKKMFRKKLDSMYLKNKKRRKKKNLKGD